MNTNIVISLDTRRKKKDGTFPLVMRVGHNARTTSIPLDINLHTNDWDAEKRIVKKTYSGSNSITRINNLIVKSKADAMDIVHKLEEAGKLDTLSVVELRDKIVRKKSSQSFKDYTTKIIANLIESNRIGTARSYKEVMAVVIKFNNERDLTFKDITYKFLTQFEQAHLAKGNSYNGLSVYTRTIRAIFNKAINDGIVEQEFYPFHSYKIKNIPTEKRALSSDLLKEIITHKLDSTHPCFHARNYFIASFFMYGMNYTDMAFLKNENIVNGRIQYRRKKTNKVYDIKITPALEKILAHYKKTNGAQQYIFPIIKRTDIIYQYKDIQWARKRYNKKLKELAKLVGVEQNLTSYVSRHSFATQAMMQQVPLNAISSMLGHSNLKTTEIYLKSLPSNILDEYNAKILQED